MWGIQFGMEDEMPQSKQAIKVFHAAQDKSRNERQKSILLKERAHIGQERNTRLRNEGTLLVEKSKLLCDTSKSLKSAKNGSVRTGK